MLKPDIDISAERNKYAFGNALIGCERGTKILYHIGPYCSGFNRGPAMEASLSGLVCLVQQRINESVTQYFAIVTAKGASNP